jgi:hypothetical protein
LGGGGGLDGVDPPGSGLKVMYRAHVWNYRELHHAEASAVVQAVCKVR